MLPICLLIKSLTFCSYSFFHSLLHGALSYMHDMIIPQNQKSLLNSERRVSGQAASSRRMGCHQDDLVGDSEATSQIRALEL
jgi:hypothetical protein